MASSAPLAGLGAALLLGCVNSPVDPGARYAGPIAPCDVPRASESPLRPPPVQADEPELWLPGPYAAWNTHPGAGCNSNPTIAVAARQPVVAVTGQESELEHRGVQIYVSYPTDGDPSYTGDDSVAGGRFPVVVFAHANNDTVCQIFESYFSLHDHWASWGFIVAAVDGTAFNCDPGSRQNIELRAQTQTAALERLRELDGDPDSPLFGHVDSSRVVFAGHSRGGGSSFVAAARTPSTRGVITLQGIDMTAFGFGSGALTELPVLGVTAGLDVDLHYPRVEPTEDQLRGPYTWVNINGGIHAYTADIVPLEFDDRPKITRRNQHALTQLYTTAFLLHVTGASTEASDILNTFRGAEVARTLSGRGVFQRWNAGSPTVWVDRFDDDDDDTNELGGANLVNGFLFVGDVATYRPYQSNPSARWSKSRSRLLKSVGPAVHETRLDIDGPLDVTQTPRLAFRMKGPDSGVVAPLSVTFVSLEGETTVAVGPEHRGALPLGNRFQQVEVDVPQAHLSLLSLRLRIGGGALLVDDLRFVGSGD